MEFRLPKHKNSKKQYPAGQFWSSDFSPEQGYDFVAKFAIGESFIFIKPMSFGSEQEPSSDASKTKIHNSQFAFEHSVELHSLIPKFDSSVSRKFEFTGGFIEIVNDISFKKDFSVNFISVDPIQLDGSWKIAQILSWDGKSNRPEWIENPDSFKSKHPFLSVVFVSKEDYIVEIGTGDDLWRWLAAEKLENATSSFSIKKRNDRWMIERKIMKFKEPSPIPTKNLRLSWFLSISKNQSSPNNEIHSEEFTIQDQNWIEASKITWNGKIIDLPCFRANFARKKMKNFIRTVSAKNNFNFVTINGVDLLICDCSSHLGRGDSKKRPHWNILELQKFKKWADRQLFERGIKTRIIPAKSSVATKIHSFS